MVNSDVEAVMEVELRAYKFPWSKGNFLDCIRSGYYCCVYHLKSKLVGYGVMSTAAGEAQILNICIDPGMQQQGLGRRSVR